MSDEPGRGFVPTYYLIRVFDDLIVSVDLADEAMFVGAEAAMAALGIRSDLAAGARADPLLLIA